MTAEKCDTATAFSAQQQHCQDDELLRTVEVVESGGIDMNMLLLYLKNTRKSGGGAIEKNDLHADPPRVTFVDVQGEFS